MSLGLGALTQDVNHLIAAMTYLGQSMHEDLKSMDTSTSNNDYLLSKQVQLSSFDLLKDFATLPTLFPDGFKVQNEPLQTSANFVYE